MKARKEQKKYSKTYDWKFPKKSNLHTQGAQYTQNRIHTKKFISRHIVVKMRKLKSQEKNLKAAKDVLSLTREHQ